MHEYTAGNWHKQLEYSSFQPSRIGRLMVPLYLVAQGILKQPVLYLSDYLERNREEYYERLTRVREKDAINDWLIFFLNGLAETAGVSQPTAYKLIDRFVEQGLLIEVTGAKRDRIFLFDAYLKLYRRP